MAKENWQRIWADFKIDIESDRVRITSEQKTQRWQSIKRTITEHFGSIKGLKTIEVGAGLGDFSLLFGSLGASVTLADYSDEAIEKAKARFKAHGQKADYRLADMLNVPEILQNKYDLSFSLGLAEHFSGNDREKIVAAHAKVLKHNGLTFISVPYRYSFLYRIWMWLRIKQGTWEYGLEIPFSKTELRELAEKSGLETLGFIQSSFFGDWQNFFPQHRVKRLLGWKIDKPSWLDHFGYALVYVGKKR